MKKKVFISGGAGFIGSFLCEDYVRRGWEVWCADNLITGSADNLLPVARDNNFVFIQEDITKIDPGRLPSDFSHVFHLASPASPPDYFNYPLETLKVNSLGTENCLRLALKCKAVFLFSSTSEVYGDPVVQVQKETYFGNVNPIGPRSVYDEGKRYGEAVVMAYRRLYGLDTRIIRIFNTYGPRMRLNDGRVVPNFICQALKGEPLTVYGDGKQTRSFCYIDDLIRGITAIVEKEYYLPVNLGNTSEFTVLKLASLVENLVGKPVAIKFMPPLEDDPKLRRPDISRAKELLNWEPRVSLQEGLEKTIVNFKERISR